MEKFLITDENLWKKIPKESGGYFLSCVVHPNILVSRPIHRILGQDFSGILYIGESENLNDRILDLKKSLLPMYKTDTHPAGKTYNNNPQLVKFFPVELLAVNFKLIEDHEEHEHKLLREYELNLGELPPFNKKS